MQRATMPTFNIHITSLAPRLQQSCASFSADFPLEPTRSPVKNPIKPPAGLHVIPGKVRPGPLPDSPGSGNTSLTDPWTTPHIRQTMLPSRAGIRQAHPRQIWTQSEQRQRRLSWPLATWESRRRSTQLSWRWTRRSAQTGQIIQSNKRTGPSIFVGRADN